jgi:prolyl-tRNA synthetase
MGALVMTHSDDNGLVLPPKLAPIQVVIIPIYKSKEEFNTVESYIEPILKKLKSKGISFLFDKRDTHKPGFKFNEHEIKGVPIRIVAGPKDIENSSLEIFRRDKMEKETINFDDVFSRIDFLITDIQNNLFERAQSFKNANIRNANTYQEFKDLIKNKGGFVSAHWDGTAETEEIIKKETKATIRCIPIDGVKEKGNCIYSKKPSEQRVLFAKAY